MIGVFLLSLFLLLIIIGLLARAAAAPPVVHQEAVMSVPVQETTYRNDVTTLSDNGEEYELGYWYPDEPIQETTLNHANSKIILN